MDNSKIIEEISDSQDLYYVAIIILSALTGSGTYSSIPALALLLDKNSFMNLVDYYGGMLLKIPTRTEISNSFKATLVYYYHDVLGMSFNEAIKKAGAEDCSFAIKKRLPYIRKAVEGFTIPKQLKNSRSGMID